MIQRMSRGGWGSLFAATSRLITTLHEARLLLCLGQYGRLGMLHRWSFHLTGPTDASLYNIYFYAKHSAVRSINANVPFLPAFVPQREAERLGNLKLWQCRHLQWQ